MVDQGREIFLPASVYSCFPAKDRPRYSKPGKCLVELEYAYKGDPSTYVGVKCLACKKWASDAHLKSGGHLWKAEGLQKEANEGRYRDWLRWSAALPEPRASPQDIREHCFREYAPDDCHFCPGDVPNITNLECDICDKPVCRQCRKFGRRYRASTGYPERQLCPSCHDWSLDQGNSDVEGEWEVYWD